MVHFSAVIKRFQRQGEKTGWTYIEIPSTVAAKLKPGTKKSFRVKGKLDNHPIEKVSLLPMGEGNFILALNKSIQKGIGKRIGATIKVNMEEDKRQIEILPELLECLEDEPMAYKNFSKLPPSHQRYYSKWITEARTEETKANRIAKTVNAMLNNLTFGQAMKS